jgi:hypothetical protein
VSNAVGKGRSVHFYFFPGTSFFYGYTANATGHRGSGGRASQWTLAGAANARLFCPRRCCFTFETIIILARQARDKHSRES